MEKLLQRIVSIHHNYLCVDDFRVESPRLFSSNLVVCLHSSCRSFLIKVWLHCIFANSDTVFITRMYMWYCIKPLPSSQLLFTQEKHFSVKSSRTQELLNKSPLLNITVPLLHYYAEILLCTVVLCFVFNVQTHVDILHSTRIVQYTGHVGLSEAHTLHLTVITILHAVCWYF